MIAIAAPHARARSRGRALRMLRAGGVVLLVLAPIVALSVAIRKAGPARRAALSVAHAAIAPKGAERSQGPDEQPAAPGQQESPPSEGNRSVAAMEPVVEPSPLPAPPDSGEPQTGQVPDTVAENAATQAGAGTASEGVAKGAIESSAPMPSEEVTEDDAAEDASRPLDDDPDGDTAGEDDPGHDPKAARGTAGGAPFTGRELEQRLKRRLAHVEYKATPLRTLLAELSSIVAVPITLDGAALTQRRVAFDTPVSVRLKEATLAEVLRAVLDPLKLLYVVMDDGVVVTTIREPAKPAASP